MYTYYLLFQFEFSLLFFQSSSEFLHIHISPLTLQLHVCLCSNTSHTITNMSRYTIVELTNEMS